MTVYMVFEPLRRGEDQLAHAERIAFVRDGFSWAAFLLAPLWMIWHRLWLVLAGYVVVMAVLGVGLWLVGVGADARGWSFLLIGLLVGVEAATLRRWSLLGRGWRDRGAVVGASRDAAERRFFAAFVTAETNGAAPAAPASFPPAASATSAATDVIGLFPQPGASR